MYVGNVPLDIGEAESFKLRQLFCEFGDIHSASVVRRTDGFQFGHVNFAKAESAAKALLAMNGKRVGEGPPLKVRLKDRNNTQTQEIEGWSRRLREEYSYR